MTVTSDLSYLPWPFLEGENRFRYGVNVEPARRRVDTFVGGWGEHIVDLGPDYVEMMALRQGILERDPHRVRYLPHMTPASWDLLMFYFREMAASYPDLMTLDRLGSGYRWRNQPLGIDCTFVPGDPETLPEHPLVFVACQIPDDVLLVTERDGHLYFDAAVVTSSADWSVKFDIGMSMHEIHRPVPGLTRDGVTDRAEQFLRRLTADQPYRRVNWTFSAVGSRRRDTSLETMPEWMDDIPRLMAEKDWGRIQLRIELEHLIRLPTTGAIVFNIRTYMAPLAEIAAYPQWAYQLADIVEELPREIAQYKGIDEYRMEAMAWLRERAA
ncbi:heme-dependent oxidative N-demethylase family protein [Rhodococcus pyridinivorans]